MRPLQGRFVFAALMSGDGPTLLNASAGADFQDFSHSFSTQTAESFFDANNECLLNATRLEE